MGPESHWNRRDLESALAVEFEHALEFARQALGVPALVLALRGAEPWPLCVVCGADECDLLLDARQAQTLFDLLAEGSSARVDLSSQAIFVDSAIVLTQKLPSCLLVAVPCTDPKAHALLAYLAPRGAFDDPARVALGEQSGAMLGRALERKLEVLKLQEQQVLHSLSEREALSGHWTLDLSTQRVYWSEAVYLIHDVDPNAYTPDLASAVEFYHPDDIPRVREALEHATRTAQPSEFRLRIVTPKGEVRHVRATLLARSTHEGEVTELFGTFSDISAVERTSEALRRQKEQFERVFHTVPVRLWIKDLDNRILALNSAALAFLGVAREVAQGALVADLFPGTAAEHHAGDLRAVHEGPQLARVERYERYDGSVGWLRTDRVAYTDALSGEPRILLSSVDVTREKHAEQALHARSDELRQANEDLEEFVRAASHDLRAPMRAISNLSQWLQEDFGDTLADEARQYLELLGSRVRRLEQLLEDLREYTLAGRSDPKVAVIHLESMVRETFDLLGLGERLTLQTDGLDGELRTATTPLAQVLRNLMDNAAKHHDRATGTLRVSAKSLGEWLEFSVTDDGPGIAIEHQERVFRSFVTLRSRDELESSGMGLATIKKLVTLAGGEVYLESSPESGRRGATFRFSWPASWPQGVVDDG